MATEKPPVLGGDPDSWIAADLKKSAISEDVARAAGLTGKPFPGSCMKDLLGFSRYGDHDVCRVTEAYLIPYLKVADEPGPARPYRENESAPEVVFGRLKLREALADAKYLAPKKAHVKHPCHLYITPPEFEKLTSPKRPLLLIEGEKKVLAVASALAVAGQADDYCLVGVAGIRQWQTAPEWKEFNIRLRGRDLILVFDADGAINADVRREELKLLAWGLDQGANVSSLFWPLIQGKGVDDFLVNGGKLQNLLEPGSDGRLEVLAKFAGKTEGQNQRQVTEIVDGLKKIKMSRMTAQVLALEIRKHWGDLSKGVLVKELLAASAPKMEKSAKEGGKGEAGDAGPRTWPKIARQYLEKLKDKKKRLLLRRWNGAYFVYRGKCYVQVDDELARAERQFFLAKHYPDLSTTTANNNLEANLMRDLFVDNSVIKALPAWIKTPGGKVAGKEDNVTAGTEPPNPQTIIPLQNGLLEIGAGKVPKLHQHTPDYFSTNVLPFTYDPAAQCPGFERFIKAALEPEYIDLAQEWGGLCLTTITKFQRFVLLYGDGGNGKGIYTNLLCEVVGADNISSLPIEALNQTDQHLEAIVGKLLNVAGEIRIRADIDDGTLKAITGESDVSINPKYKKAFKYRPQCKLMFSANKVPSFSDKSDAVWRRLMLIPFRRTPRAIDFDLEERLKREELPGVFNWFLEGLNRLLTNNGFSIPDDMADDIKRRKHFSDPVLLFLYDYVLDSPGQVMPERLQGAKFYQEYEDWSKDNGFTRYKFSAVGLLEELNRICGGGVSRQNAWLEGKTQYCLIFTAEAREKLKDRLADFGGTELIEGHIDDEDLPFGDDL